MKNILFHFLMFGFLTLYSCDGDKSTTDNTERQIQSMHKTNDLNINSDKSNQFVVYGGEPPTACDCAKNAAKAGTAVFDQILQNTCEKYALTLSKEDKKARALEGMECLSNSQASTIYGRKSSSIKSESVIVYKGKISSGLGGIGSLFYTVKLKNDFSAASINGPMTELVQSDIPGVYMWNSGSLLGMSIQPTSTECTIYSADGELFGTLYRSGEE